MDKIQKQFLVKLFFCYVNIFRNHYVLQEINSNYLIRQMVTSRYTLKFVFHSLETEVFRFFLLDN